MYPGSQIWQSHFARKLVILLSLAMGPLSFLVPDQASATLSCAAGGTCVVGDVGPAGGIVIYVGASVIDQAAGISAGGLNLEAAPSDFTTASYNWCDGPNNGNTTLIGAADASLGAGASNTAVMVSRCAAGAGNVAANYSKNGYSDWFLPSQAELLYLNAKKSAIGMNNSSLYWGSNEAATWVAASLVTWVDAVGGQNKAQATPLWPIRAFSPGDPIPGPGSIHFVASSHQYIRTAGDAGTAMGTGDFTYEAWVYPTSVPALWDTFFESRAGNTSGSGAGFYFGTVYHTLTPMYYRDSGEIFHSSRALTLNSWNHVALVRRSGTTSIYVNGLSGGSVSGDTNNWTSAPVTIGGSQDNNLFFDGYISNARIVKGTAVYTSNFTVPTTALTTISGTQILLSTTNDYYFTADSSTYSHVFTSFGGPTASSLNPFPNLLSRTISFATTSYSHVYGETQTVVATASTGSGAITYSASGGACTVDSSTGIVTITAGSGATCSISASVASDGTYATATTVTPVAITVSKANQSSQVMLTSTSATYGTDMTLTASGGSGGGSLSYVVNSGNCTISGSVLSSSSAGTCYVTATRAATANYNFASSDSTTVSVAQKALTITGITGVNRSFNGTDTGTVTGTAALSGVINSDSVSLSGTPVFRFASVGPANSIALTASGYTLTGAKASNYSLTQPVLSANIIPVLTLTFNANGGVSDSSTATYSSGDAPISLPTPRRTNYTFLGWFDAQNGGSQVASPYSPASTQTIWAHWIQNSLYGMSGATKIGSITTISGLGNTFAASLSDLSNVSISYPADALPASSIIDIYLLNDTSTISSFISGTNNYILSLAATWVAPDGTVPNTVVGKPLAVTVTNPAIKKGAKIYTINGGVAAIAGTVATDGVANVSITSDPDIVITSQVPDAPTIGNASIVSGTTATISYTAPASNGGATITSYTAISTPESITATAVTSGSGFITVPGLTRGHTYTFTVKATNSVGASLSSASSNAIQTIDLPALSLSALNETGTVGVAITPNSISNAGGTANRFSITPRLQSGLNFDTSTGLISGTPTYAQQSTPYVITATNSAGDSLGAAFNLAVVDPSPTPTAVFSAVPVAATEYQISSTTFSNAKIDFSTPPASAAVVMQKIDNPVAVSSTPFVFSSGGKVFDIAITGVTGAVTICLDGDSNSHLWHFESGTWNDITTSHTSTQVCGSTSTFSPFYSAPRAPVVSPVISAPAAPDFFELPQVQSELRLISLPKILKTNQLVTCGSGTYVTASGAKFGVQENPEFISTYTLLKDGLGTKFISVETNKTSWSWPLSSLTSLGLYTCSVQVKYLQEMRNENSALRWSGQEAAKGVLALEIAKANAVFTQAIKRINSDEQVRLLQLRESWLKAVKISDSIYRSQLEKIRASTSSAGKSKLLLAAQNSHSSEISRLRASYEDSLVALKTSTKLMPAKILADKNNSIKSANDRYVEQLLENGVGLLIQ